MADNISVTEGSGKAISTEEVTTLNGSGVSAQHMQRVGLALRTADTTAVDVPGDSANGIDVDVTRMAALPAGDNNIGNVDIVTMPDATVVGKVADDATASGNPVLVGGVAVETDGTDPTSVSAEGDLGYVRTDRQRRMLVNKSNPFAWRVNANNATAQTNSQLKANPGANLSLYITDIIISNGATAGTVKIVEDQAGTPVDLLGPYYFAINGGCALHFETPIRLTANKTLGFTSTTVTTHSISVCGYTAP